MATSAQIGPQADRAVRRGGDQLRSLRVELQAVNGSGVAGEFSVRQDNFDLADIGFTRKLEDDLDAVAEARAKRLDVLQPFHERLQAQIDRRNDELAYLHEEVQEAYEREERRREEFVIEREISPVPYRAMIMPWTRETESERRFQHSILAAMLICIFFGILIPWVNVPLPNYTAAVVEIPDRLAKLVKKEPPRPARMPKPMPEQPQEQPKQPQKEAYGLLWAYPIGIFYNVGGG